MNARTIARLGMVAAVPVLVACEPEPTGPGIADRYALVSVDGRPLPAAIDSFTTTDGRMRLLRITGRFIVAFSPDSAQYTVTTDVVERATGGGFNPVAAECRSTRVGWRRAGSNVLLDFTGFPSPPVPAVDTLRVSGRRLLQKLRVGDPVDDAYVLSYIADGLGRDGCGFPG